MGGWRGRHRADRWRKQVKTRNNLSESLEQYAARMGLPPDRVRITWRLQGLRILDRARFHDVPWEELVPLVQNTNSPRIAPGVELPTRGVTIWDPGKRGDEPPLETRR